MSKQQESMSEKDMRLGPVPRIIATVFTTIAIAVSILYIFNVVIFGRCMVEYGYFNLLQAMLFPLSFLFFPAHRRPANRLPWYDILLAFLSFAIAFTFFLKAYDIIFKGWEIDAPKWIFSLALVYWILILEGVRRVGGLFFCVFLLIASAYPLFADMAPGVLRGSGYSLYRITNYHMLSSEGVNGLVFGTVGRLLIGFLIFGSVLASTGAGKAFLAIAMALFGKVRGGAAKTSVVSSALVGSISGSAVTNVITTGCITIPAMKKAGYPAHYAGAVETCASTGGVLMPPVMGAVAFIMAAFLDIFYIQVALAAVIPIFLYYLGLFIQVDAFAAKAGIKGLPKSEIPSLGRAIRDMLPYLLAFIALVWLLIVLRREGQAPFYSIPLVLAGTMLRKETRLGFKQFIDLIYSSGRMLAELVPTFLGVGFVVSSMFITGIAQSLSSIILTLAGGNVYLLLLLGGITCFILGMGMTVSACYVLLAILLAPSLVQMGLDRLAVHLFIAYTAMLSYITPPVALAAYAAASLAGAPPMKTGLQAVRLGVVIFIIPFLFVLNPAFVLHGTPIEIIHVVGTGIVGVILLASGVEGYLIGMGRLAPVSRAITVTSGVLLFLPWLVPEIIGAGLFIAFILATLAIRRRVRVS